MTNFELPDFEYTPKSYDGPSAEEVLSKRQQYLNPGIYLLYKKPIMFVEGKMQYLFDEKGRRYLDLFGGIVTVSIGHCHPYVNEAAKKQIDLLQHSPTIYLNPQITQYAEKLVSKMPGKLNKCYFVNSGSEANDLAILMSRLYTGNYDVIALRNAYHGGNQLAMGLTAHSTWKYNVPHKFGIHHVMNADPYQGIWGYDDPNAGENYANEVNQTIQYSTSGKVAAFISESIQGVGGAVVYPDGYLKKVYQHTRDAGGLCISDEVQAGFARPGSHFWGFETHGVIPDIVTMAKGIGNGVPLAAVVTTSEVAEVIKQKIHFNTYGGNPVSCAIGSAVLDVIEKEDIQKQAADKGAYLTSKLEELKEKHQIIGDVRGRGLMIGVELVKDRTTKKPASEEAGEIMERCKELGVIIGKGGLAGNTIRIKPPMCLSKDDIDLFINVFDHVLTDI